MAASLIWLACDALAQTESGSELPNGAAREEVSVDTVEAQRAAIERSTEIEEETKKKLLDLYKQAADSLGRAADMAARTAKFKAATENVKQRVDDLNQQLAQLHNASSSGPVLRVAALSLAELEQLRAKKELELNDLKARVTQLEAEAVGRANRRKDMRAALVAAPKRLDEVNQQLELPAPNSESPDLSRARRIELVARKKLVEQELPFLQTELAMYDAEEAAGLLRLERDVAALKIAQAEKELTRLDEVIRRQRATAAEAAVRDAQEAAFQAAPFLKPIAQHNQQLAEQTQKLTQLIEQTQSRVTQAQDQLDEWTSQFAQIRQKVDSVGLTGAIGRMLRKQQNELPRANQIRNRIRKRRPTVDQIQLEWLEYETQLSPLGAPAETAELILEQAPRPRDAAQKRQLHAAARELVDRQREYLDTLLKSYGRYYDSLIALDTTEEQLARLIDDYRTYIRERVLWIRSGRLLLWDLMLLRNDLNVPTFSSLRHAARQGLDDAKQQPVVYALALLIFTILFLLRLGLRRRITELGERAQQPRSCDFLITLRTLVLTVLLACLWPVLLLFFAWRLAGWDHPWATTLASGLGLTCWGFFPLELLRQACRPCGLGQSHFDWPVSGVRVLRKNLQSLMVFGLPLVFTTAVIGQLAREPGNSVLERIGFITAALFLSVLIARVLRPSGGAFQEYIAYHQGGWVDRLQIVWYWLGTLAPAALAALTFFGFYYAATQLAWRLYITILMTIALVMMASLLLRLLLIQRRRLSIAQARKRLQALSAAAEQKPSDGQPNVMADVKLSEAPEADLATHSSQTRRLVTSGMAAALLVGSWLIWVDVLPALRMLEQRPLWTTAVQQTELVTAADGTEKYETRDIHKPITIISLAFAALIGVVMIVASRNIPGLLEISLLQRLPVEPSVRYAITTLGRYVIILVGIIIAFGQIGLQWSQVQWLATALTFGLAFGLQEMFANFVSGLIILFERPIRVGDIVTVGDVSGVVSRVRMRATTITNWDRQEYVVPNKEFITGRVLNWTLSDTVNRVVVEVGVAYSSDVRRVRQLLLEIAVSHPSILADPAPMATFEGFGDSTLKFTLRAYLAKLENRLDTIHDLHVAVLERFHSEGIEIAFPQRDLHIRSVPVPGPSFAWAASGKSNGSSDGQAEGTAPPA